uniref:Uncharacterized protein n=1 Tax=Aegilops tauschii subsp. strangulata TaxID=200361 RepID=A0A453A1W6_AEGTS
QVEPRPHDPIWYNLKHMHNYALFPLRAHAHALTRSHTRATTATPRLPLAIAPTADLAAPTSRHASTAAR